MRVIFLVVLFTIFNISAFATSSCHMQILESTTKSFHKFIEQKLNLQDSQKDFYKTIGFKSTGTESGIKLLLNIELSELKSITGANEYAGFDKLIKEFFNENKREGSLVSSNSFYPDESKLPCLDETLYLSEQKHCLNGFDSLDNEQIGELKNLIENIFKSTQINLREIDPNEFRANKKVKVIANQGVTSLDGFELQVDSSLDSTTSTIGGASACSINKNTKSIECDFKKPGTMIVEISNGTYSGFITLKYSKDQFFKLNKLSSGEFNVLKITESNQSGEVMENFTIEEESKKFCSKKTSKIIKCLNQDYEIKLLVNIEEEILTEKIEAKNNFYFSGDASKNPLYVYLRPVVIKDGKEDLAALESVILSDIKDCEVISTKRKLLKCLRKDAIYTVKATKDNVEIEFTVADNKSIGRLDLKISDFKMNSMEQYNLIQVTNNGSAISLRSLADLGIDLSIEGSSKLIENQSAILSDRKESAYTFKVTLKKGDQIKEQSVEVSKYVANNSFYFEISKENKYCRFNLKRSMTLDDQINVGLSSYSSEYLDIEITKDENVSCSDVQNNGDSTQVICTIPKSVYSGSATLKLLSNGNVIRTQSCNLVNSGYRLSFEEEDYDDDDDWDGEFRGKTYKKRSVGADIGVSAADVFSAILPEYLSGKYGNQNNNQYYNPMMYQPYYYGGPMLPSGYGAPAWDTRYIFDTATY